MEERQPGLVVHQAEAPIPTRRGVVGRLATVAVALGIAALPGLSEAKQHAHKRRKKRKHKAQAETCQERCHPSCTRCFHRPEGTPLCGSQGSLFCLYQCETDSQCVGTGHPYCITGSTFFATGEFHGLTCLNNATSVCGDVNPCG
jgi:hypothetical protein